MTTNIPANQMRQLRWVPWLLVIGLVAWYLWRGQSRVTATDQHLGDFRHFFWGAEAVWHGDNPYLEGAKHLEMDGRPVEVDAYDAAWTSPLPPTALANGLPCVNGALTRVGDHRIAVKGEQWDTEVILIDKDIIRLNGKLAMLHDLQPGMTIFTNGRPERNGYIYPPLLAFCYSPLTPLGITNAARVVVEVDVLLLFGGIFFLGLAVMEAFGPPPGMDRVFVLGVLMAITCILGWDRIKSEIQMLQSNSTVFFMWSLGFYLLRKRPFAAGLALGFAFNVKYVVIASLPYLLLRRQWKAAAGMVTGIAFWGMLPALLVGPGREIGYLKTAYGGILRLLGVPLAGDSADVEPLASGFSFSIPSGLARSFAWHNLDWNPMTVTAMIGVVWVLGMVGAYLWFGAPFMGRMRDGALAAAEYAALIGVTLALSPQAGPRHALMTIGLCTVGTALIWFRPIGWLKWPVAATLLTVTFGMSWPPGNGTGVFTGLAGFWQWAGMPYWCVLFGCTVVPLVALYARRALAGGSK